MSKRMLIAVGKACFFSFTPFTMAKHHLWELLVHIKNNSHGLRQEVARSIMSNALEETDDALIEYIQGLTTYGCASGSCSDMIWYADTEAFFDRHYLEIDELRMEFEDNIGEPFRIQYRLKNYLAWFAYEETVRSIADELGIEL